jgi:cell division septation protein DedD
MSDEGFHEIQLNGKQLVFLFMAATVVSVVIFLCGVLVGRGVRAGEPQAAESTTAAVAPDPGVAGAPPTAEPSPPAPPIAPIAPIAPIDDLSYPDRLQRDAPPEEAIAPAPVADAPPPRTRPAPAPAAVSSAPPSASGFVVQVAALRDQKDADAIVKRLIGKGYPAYVLAPAQGAPAPVYRVQVGKFSNLREADETAARLEKEEHFKPWIRR